MLAVTSDTLSNHYLVHIVNPKDSMNVVLIVEELHWYDLETFYDNLVPQKQGGVCIYPNPMEEYFQINTSSLIYV